MTNDSRQTPQTNRMRRTALMCAGLAFGMVGLAFASVPLYDLFCRVTGFGGTPMVADGPASRITDRRMTIRFDSNVAPGLDWRFRPEATSVEVKVGETREVAYAIGNAGTQEQTGVATFNVQPELAGAYFTKIQCFCFTERTLAGGASEQANVVFYVDPAIEDDPNLKNVHTITLSYTFFPAKTGNRTKPLASVQTDAEPKL